MKKNFGERLRELRGSCSQAEIATKIGVSSQSWGFYERNQKEPTLETIGIICKLFRISSDWLLGLGGVAETKVERAAGLTVAPDAPSGDEAYWRNLVASQQETIVRLTALLAEGRSIVVPPAGTGGCAASKTA